MVRSTAAFEEYFQHTISHALQLSVSPTFLLAKLAQVEDSNRASEAASLSLQLRLHDVEQRLVKCRDEAAMNASALRTQIAENQNLQCQLQKVSQRSIWLEEECSLYHNDRELFRGVAEEAEDRACRAEEQCNEAARRMEQMKVNLDDFENLKSEHEKQKEELDQLRSKMCGAEASNENLQAKLLKVQHKLAQLSVPQAGLEAHAASVSSEDNVLATSSSAKKIENTGSRERPGTPQLMAEVQRLWKEVALYKCNLARAEIQVRILDDDNKELRLALRNRMSTAASPLSKKGKTSSSLIDNMGIKKDARQPLSKLEPNLSNLR